MNKLLCSNLLSGLAYHQGIRVIRRFLLLSSRDILAMTSIDNQIFHSMQKIEQPHLISLFVSSRLEPFNLQSLHDIKWIDFLWPVYCNFIFFLFKYWIVRKFRNILTETSLKFSWGKISRNRPYSYRAGLRFGESCSILRHHVG